MPARREVVIWDPLVRVFHWSTAALFLANYWLLEGGEDLHEWAGYAIAALLAVRIVWGVAGSPNARFANFLPTRSRLHEHWQQLRSRQLDPSTGHNPLGALMILFMLVLLALTALTGWMQGLDRFWGEEWVQQTHERAADILMVSVALHVVAVIAISRWGGLSLIRAMVTGRRSLPTSD